jgi:hypothetical protein
MGNRLLVVCTAACCTAAGQMCLPGKIGMAF